MITVFVNVLTKVAAFYTITSAVNGLFEQLKSPASVNRLTEVVLLRQPLHNSLLTEATILRMRISINCL
jgi:hypothetical protein